MNDIDNRLTRCFQAVLPNIPAANVAQASVETVPAWDSVALVNLLNLISEEFGIEVEWERAEELTSYPAIREMVVTRTASP